MIKISNILKVFSQLYNRYNKLGFEIYGSYSPLLNVYWPSNYVVKKNKTKATMGSIKKNRWPYKTIKPDGDFSETLKHLKGNAKKKKFK